MTISRIFSGEKYKGTFGYLDTQKVYEIIRTVLFYSISIAIFVTGYVTTGTKKNLLTIVAVLGVLPASKSLVSVIMFLRYKSFKEKIDCNGLLNAYDMIFTSEKINYRVSHLCVSDSCIIGYSDDPKFDENKFKDHVTSILAGENFKNITVKVFTDKKAYLYRISSLKPSEGTDENVMTVLKQIVL